MAIDLLNRVILTILYWIDHKSEFKLLFRASCGSFFSLYGMELHMLTNETTLTVFKDNLQRNGSQQGTQRTSFACVMTVSMFFYCIHAFGHPMHLSVTTSRYSESHQTADWSCQT